MGQQQRGWGRDGTIDQPAVGFREGCGGWVQGWRFGGAAIQLSMLRRYAVLYGWSLAPASRPNLAMLQGVN
jgi:hypothetical protein